MSVRLRAMVLALIGAATVGLAGPPAAGAQTYSPETSSRFPFVQFRSSSAGLGCEYYPWANEAQMIDECWQPHRDTYVYDAGRGNRIGDTGLLDSRMRAFYSGGRFNYDLNFIFWAPVSTITAGAGWDDHWYGCPVPGYRASYMHIGGFCPDDQVGSPADGFQVSTLTRHPVGEDLTNRTFRAKHWNGNFIALACGNPNTMNGVAGPVPLIQGRTFHDRDRSGGQNGSEPYLGGFTLRLLFNGSQIATDVSAANGSYAFPLSATGHGRFGAGTYRVEILTRLGWQLIGTTGRQTFVDWNAGAQTETWDFGAWQIPTVSIDDVTVDPEGTGTDTTAGFTVSLSQTTGVPISVDVTTEDGTAVSPADYAGRTQRVTIPANTTTVGFPVTVVGDALDEFDEQFRARLSSPSFSIPIGHNPGVATIIDDDEPPVVSIGDARVDPEGGPGDRTPATLTVELDAPSGKPIAVSYCTRDGVGLTGAVAPGDYDATCHGTVNFAPGETQKTIEVIVNGDALDEFDESAFVDLSDPVNARSGDMEGEVVIVDDDAPPTVSIADADPVIEGDSGQRPATFTVSLSAPSGKPIDVTATTADGTAVAPGDYRVTIEDLRFNPLQTVKTVDVPVQGDTLAESDETFAVNLGALVNVDPGDLNAIGTIIDDERAGAFLCRASVLRLNDLEVRVANAPELPCVGEQHQILRPNLGGLVTVQANIGDVRTAQSPVSLDETDPAVGDHARADTTVTDLLVRIGATTIRADVIESHALARCDRVGFQPPVLSSSSRIAGLKVNNIPITVDTGPQSITIAGIELHLNRTILADGRVTRRGLQIRALGGLVDLVVAEAKAGGVGSPCADKPFPSAADR